jgi:hypothetical protein
MLKTLHRRLLLSHVLPLLVTVPLTGIALIYVLETQVLWPSLANGLVGEAELIANVLGPEADIWSDPPLAETILVRLSPDFATRLILLDADGHPLASSTPADVEHLDRPLERSCLAQALSGKVSICTVYSQQIWTGTVDVLTPVEGPGQQIKGVVHLSHQLSNVQLWFIRLRHLVGGVLITGLMLGTTVGWVLARDLGRPLEQVSQAICQLASDQRPTPLPERGPIEMRLLAHDVNKLGRTPAQSRTDEPTATRFC